MMCNNSNTLNIVVDQYGHRYVLRNGQWVSYDEWIRDPRRMPGWIYANNSEPNREVTK